MREAPLCAVCVVEAEVDGVSEDAVMRRGLRRVDRMDGGVTRKRWELNTNEERVLQCKHDGVLVWFRTTAIRHTLLTAHSTRLRDHDPGWAETGRVLTASRWRNRSPRFG